MLVDTFDQKEPLLERLTDLAGKGNLVFRGYNTQEQLLPSVVRRKSKRETLSNLPFWSH